MLKRVSPSVRQYVIVFIVNLPTVCFGMAVAWVSPVMVKLAGQATPLRRPLSDEEGSWIVSAASLSNIFANALAAYLVDHWGRKKCVCLSFLPKITACILYVVASEFWMLLLSRVLDGLSESLVFTTVPMYASEIAYKEIRGALGTIFQVCASLGVVTMLCIGPYLSYFNLNVVYLCASVFACVPTVFLPESPYFLFSKGRLEECQKTLTFLRGDKSLAEEEIKEYTPSTGTKLDKSLFSYRVFLKTIFIITILGIGNQAVGFNAVSFYLQTILESSNTSVRSEEASVIIGLIQLFAAFCTQAITDKFGRKVILATTLIGMAVGLVGLGVFFKLKDGGSIVTGFLNYLPLISLVVFVFCFSAGLGSTFWTLIPELLEGPTRAIGVSISLTTTTIATFITAKYFVYMIDSLGPATTYWLFAGICVVFCLFITIFVPETKQKSFAEIQRALGAKNEVSRIRENKNGVESGELELSVNKTY